MGVVGFRQRAALAQPVGVAAHVALDVAARLEGEHAGDDRVEKHPVVAHDDQRALVFVQPVLEHLEGFHVEVVGRLVEDQEVGGPGEQPGQDHPVAFAAGQ